MAKTEINEKARYYKVDFTKRGKPVLLTFKEKSRRKHGTWLGTTTWVIVERIDPPVPESHEGLYLTDEDGLIASDSFVEEYKHCNGLKSTPQAALREAMKAATTEDREAQREAKKAAAKFARVREFVASVEEKTSRE